MDFAFSQVVSGSYPHKTIDYVRLSNCIWSKILKLCALYKDMEEMKGKGRGERVAVPGCMEANNQ